MTLLTPVKSRLFIAARRLSWGLLDGEYASVFRGRSLDYDDLRDYVPGDEIRDIDWKATARHGSPLVKRYVAMRKQTVVFVVDTGRSMAAHAAGGESKSAVAITACGMLGYLAVRHGDLVGLVCGDSGSVVMTRPRDSEAQLELMLQQIDRRTSLTAGRSDLATLLELVAERVARRVMLVIVSDDRELAPDALALVRRLQAQHELLWLSIDDADPTAASDSAHAVLDVTDDTMVPDEVRGDRRLRAAYLSALATRREDLGATLHAIGIVRGNLGASAQAVGTIVDLLQRQRRRVR